MKNNVINLLNEYLEQKIALTPSEYANSVVWEECENDEYAFTDSYELNINGFCPGIVISSSELLNYVLNKHNLYS